MTPPPEVAIDMHSATGSDDLNRIKWAGWILLGIIVPGWAVWISVEAIENNKSHAVLEERQRTQYETLRDDIAEIKAILTRRERRPLVSSKPDSGIAATE